MVTRMPRRPCNSVYPPLEEYGQTVYCERDIPEGWKGHSGKHLACDDEGRRVQWWGGAK